LLLAVDDVLVVMARYPEPGRVKSRLAAEIGPEAAARLYAAFLEDLARRLGSAQPWGFVWAYDPPDAPFPDRIARGLAAFPQPDGDLGRRMAGSMERALRDGAASVVLIGSDVPHLPPRRIAGAFDRLAAGADVVLGPAEDGGYYLIGSRRPVPLFDDVSWGTSKVLAETLERARRGRIEVALLESDFDVDSQADVERLARAPVLAELSMTARVLSAMKIASPGGS